jgi:hypothetical protein
LHLEERRVVVEVIFTFEQLLEYLIWVVGAVLTVIVRIAKRELTEEKAKVASLQLITTELQLALAYKIGREELERAVQRLEEKMEAGFQRCYDKLDDKADKAY